MIGLLDNDCNSRSVPTPRSYDVIRQACEDVGVKHVARCLNVSPALVYKWCEAPETSDAPDASGAKNPIDRVAELYRITRDIHLIRYLSNVAGGFFVANPAPVGREAVSRHLLSDTQCLVREFSELLNTVTGSIDTPGICDTEATDIRRRWEDLKSVAEQFVVTCEQGHYRETR